MVNKPHVRVVAAEIERNGRFLITQRRPEATFPLLWEFPSGKVEEGEGDAAALARELEERLAAQVEVGSEVLAVEREYERYVVDFHVYACQLLNDDLQKLRVRDFRWVSLAELSDYEFPPADQESVDILLQS